MKDKDRRPNQAGRTKGKKCKGVITCYLGEPESPVLQALETYCIMNEITVSEAVRRMIQTGLTLKGYMGEANKERT